MKKSILKKALSMALSCALVVSSITVYNSEAKAATLDELTEMVADAEYNLALNKDTTIYPGCAEGNQANLNNGALGAGGAHCAISSAWGYLNESYAVIDLGEYYDASSIDQILIQYKDAAENDTVVGRTYKIEYSVDSVSYYDVITETSVSELDENRMTIDNVSGTEGVVRYIRVYYPTTATYGIQITEIAVFAENPVIAEVETCDEAAGVSVEVTDYNTIKYNITAGENQEDYVYMVYLDGTTKIGEAVSAGVDYVVEGIEAGTHVVKVIAVYDGKVSLGISSEEITVSDVSVLITDGKNIANANNNSEAAIISVADLYDETYTIESAQSAIDGLYPSGEGASVALRTAAGVTPATFVLDLGDYYRAVEFDKAILAYSNPRTYAGTATIEFSEDNENYTEVGYNEGYTCAKDNAGAADLNVFSLNAEQLDSYVGSVRYVRVTLADGVSNWGYVVNEFGLILNTDSPVTGLQPKLNDIAVDTQTANTVAIKVASTVGFEDAEYKAVLLDEDSEETGYETELSLEEGYFVGTISDVAEGNYKIKIVVDYEGGTKTVDKTVSDVMVHNPTVSRVEANADTANEIAITWEVTGYYGEQAYNIYLDGELYEANVDCEESSEAYTVTGVAAGTHSIAVAIVIDGEEGKATPVESIVVNPAEITIDSVDVNINRVDIAWSHSLVEGEEAEYTVSLKGTDKTATVGANEDGVYEYTFDNLPIGSYTVVVEAVVNGLTVSAESEEVQILIGYAVEPNAFKLFIYTETKFDEEVEASFYINDEEVVCSTADMIYDEESKLYTYVKYLAKGTYEVKFDEDFVLCTAEIEDVVATPVTNLTCNILSENSAELTWDSANAPEGQTYTIYIEDIPVLEGVTETSFSYTGDIPVGTWKIKVVATYVNPYSQETYTEESAVLAVVIDPAPTTAEPTTKEPATETPSTVAPTKANKVTPPARAKVKSASKKKATKKVKVSIKKVKGAKGYQVQFSTTKKFKKVLVKKTVKKATVTISNKRLKKAKKLFVRVKAYKLNGKKKVWAKKWSKVKKVKIKK